jgi:DegV family protein with EDD domain
MGSICIVTDNLAQFASPLSSYLQSINIIDCNAFLSRNLPLKQSLQNEVVYSTIQPVDVNSFNEIITTLYQTHDNVLAITASRYFSSFYTLLEETIEKMHAQKVIHLIDSQNFGISEGLIIEKAAILISQGLKITEIETRLRQQISHYYTVLSTPSLDNLYNSGLIDEGQAISSEILSIIPVFSIEDGKINPLEKTKNVRAAIEYFIEFVDEFDSLDKVIFIQPSLPLSQEAKLIKQHLDEFSPGTLFSEQSANPFLLSLIGSNGFGIVVAEPAK